MRALGASGKATGRPICHHHHAPDTAATTSTSHANSAMRDDGEDDGDMHFLEAAPGAGAVGGRFYQAVSRAKPPAVSRHAQRALAMLPDPRAA